MDNIRVVIYISLKGTDIQIQEMVDYTEYAKDLIECNNIFDDLGIPMTEDNILHYFKDISIDDTQIDALNGSHFIFGYIEALAQEKSSYGDMARELAYKVQSPEDLLIKTRLLLPFEDYKVEGES